MLDWKTVDTREQMARKWLLSNVPEESSHNTPELYMESWRNIYKDMWQYWNEVLLTEEIDGQMQMPLHYWYAAQYCLSPESYWTALTKEWDLMAWESVVEYDLDSWTDIVCTGWGIGCPSESE